MIQSDLIYLDHAATTPILSQARDAVAQGHSLWANPSSPHGAGRTARAALEGARRRIAETLDWPHEVILTSGASEALAIALTRAQRPDRAIGATEHDAVHRVAGDAQILPVGNDGIVDIERVPENALVAVQQVNNETGVIQPLAEIAEVVRGRGGLLLADCAQSAGKLPLPDADFIALSGHKFGAPPGIGALLVRDLSTLTPSGGQEKGYRPGTENLPGALGMAAALECGDDWLAHAQEMRAWLDHEIEYAGGEVIAADAPRLATITSYRMPGIAATVQLIRFDAARIAVSAGSACSSGSMKPSHVLAAMSLDAATIGETIRVSFGPDTRRQELVRFLGAWRDIAGRARAA